MKVAVIGLGDIARKAYLPLLNTLPGVELHLHTRTPATLDEVADAYHVPPTRRHRKLADLLAVRPDAALVHAPTETHPPLVTRLLEADVPTYVDKPLAHHLEDARRLADLAEDRAVQLTVGFNRRFAPGYAQCRQHPRELILLQKHRVGLPAEPRRVVYDDFIHVADTLRFLAPGPITGTQVHGRVRDGHLHHLSLQLTGDGFTALGIMNRRSGSAEEVLEVSGQDSKREVRNLAEIIDHKGQPSVRRRGDWVSVARQRGIEGAVTGFLDAVRNGGPLTAEDALRTHELCERIVTELTPTAGEG